MSGTSLDGLDGVLAALPAPGVTQAAPPQILAAHYLPYPDDFRRNIAKLLIVGNDEMARAAQLAIWHSELSAKVVDVLVRKTDQPIRAIGSHGQTVRHFPAAQPPYSVQLGNGAVLAELTGLTTVCDFRSRDLAAGGEGAPLVPAFHRAIFSHPEKNRAVVNIGGIANITVLPAVSERNREVLGFDTGPGNTLLDGWAEQHLGQPFDADGGWARQGVCDEALLADLLSDPYFSRAAPKSAGREYFHLEWLTQFASAQSLSPEEVQATLVELTARSIADAVHATAPDCASVYLCGGGAKNRFLVQRLQANLGCELATTDTLGLAGQHVEAAAFAWLAQQAVHGLSGNLPGVTGAQGSRVLGAIYPA